MKVWPTKTAEFEESSETSKMMMYKKSITMASSQLIRRMGVVAVGAGMYVGATVLAFQYMTSGQEEQEEAQSVLVQRAGFSFVANPSRNEQYQHVAHCYDDHIGRDEAYMGINLLRRMILYFHSKGTVLEVGAGTGRNIPYYPSSVNRVLLTDMSDQMLLRAQQKLAKLSPEKRSGFACVEADAQKLDFPDGYFDTVVDTFGLCSYNDPVLVLNEMGRVCKPTGKVLLLEHGRSKTWNSITKYLDRNAERHAKNWGCVWNRDLDDVIEKSDLQVDRVDTWHFGTTYYVVARPKQQVV